MAELVEAQSVEDKDEAKQHRQRGIQLVEYVVGVEEGEVAEAEEGERLQVALEGHHPEAHSKGEDSENAADLVVKEPPKHEVEE